MTFSSLLDPRQTVLTVHYDGVVLLYLLLSCIEGLGTHYLP